MLLYICHFLKAFKEDSDLFKKAVNHESSFLQSSYLMLFNFIYLILSFHCVIDDYRAII